MTCDAKTGFVIEAVFSLPPETGISNQLKPSWPWEWNGKEAVVPNVDGDAGTAEPVYRLRVRGRPSFRDCQHVGKVFLADAPANSGPCDLFRDFRQIEAHEADSDENFRRNTATHSADITRALPILSWGRLSPWRNDSRY